jgi:hypothetical protein
MALPPIPQSPLFDFLDRDPRDFTQGLTFDVHHGVGELGDHVLLLTAVEDSLDDFDLYERRDASFAFAPDFGSWDPVSGGRDRRRVDFSPRHLRGAPARSRRSAPNVVSALGRGRLEPSKGWM